MQNKLTSFCLALMSLCSAHAVAQLPAASPQYAEGVVRVKLQPSLAAKVEKADLTGTATNVAASRAAAKYVTTGVQQLDAMAQKVHAVSMKRVFPYAGKDEAKHKKYGLDQWYDITYDNTEMSLQQVKNLYKSTVGVMHAQRVPAYTISDSQKYLPISPAQIAKAQQAAATMPFNDPMLSAQWHYHNDGSISGTKAGADINVFPAWESGVTGSSDVIVAIVDGGFQVTHPDLKDNVWINEAELNGKPGVDDDGDGYVDDIYGWNFVVNSSNINAHSHGTHVAGTVGATNGNGIGVCGVAGGKDGEGGVKMMVCQVFDTRASSSAVADFGAALVYAADRGASIAQCSWGLSTADEEDQATSEGVRYFTKEGGGDKMNGGLCIFASGNTNDEGNYYPGCMSEVVGVAATTATGAPAYYSSRGTWVDVSAPGGLMDNDSELGVLSTLPDDSYGYNEGTSMACPHVSGIAALILSKYGNKNFSNETLRTMLTTSVNDIYSNYPEYKGLFGSGCIDAYKALQGNEGSVPQAVGDYTLTASHDNVLVEWTVPESDEKVIDHHVIYYSTSEFDASADLSKLNSVSVDTKYKMSGDTVSYELTGLKANTTYYFTIVAYNRWGKASTAAAVKSATTNEGPTAQLDKSSLTLKLDASKASTTEGSFNISNTGKGVLKYELASSTIKATYSTSARQGKPTPGNVVAFGGKMGTASTSTSSSSSTLVTSDYQASDWPEELSYINYVRCYLGETDTELPNAMAQYFKVDKDSFPKGFNLTALNINGAYGDKPVIEIYDGSRSISTASLLTTVSYDYFTFGSDLNLQEQLYFAPGTSFWVVVKFPAGYTNPLAAAISNTDGTENYSFYSSDNGQSWTQLTEVLKGTSFESISSQLTWAITAKSKNPDWSQVLNPEPLKGEVRASEKQTVTVKNDGQKMVNGTYRFNLKVNTNESNPTDHNIQVNMTVSGNKPVVSSKQMIDFGSLLVGESKTMEIELTNAGYGVFGGKYGAGFYSYNKTLTCSSDQFDISAGAPSVPARSSKTMTMKFKPTKAGTFSGTVTLTDKDKNTYSFTVYGIANEPPHLSMEQTEFDMGDLNVDGTEKTQTFTLKNDGKYPLQYVFPKYSDKSIEGSTTKAHKFGYTYETNLTGDTPQYEAAPELSDETDITSQFSDQIWLSGAIDLGFKFPFYGDTYDKVYVTTHGGISMTSVSGSIGCFVPEPSCMSGLGYISAFGNSGYPGSLFMRGGSKVSYGHKDGKFVVKFHDVATLGSDGSDIRVSFHINLCPDGSAEIFYDNLEAQQLRENGTLMYIGVADKTVSDPFTITDTDMSRADENSLGYQITSGTAIKIVAPGTSMVKSVSSTDGYIGIGEQKDITVTVAAGDGFNAGALTNNLVVLTNDPENASKNIVLKANIVGDGLVPVAAVSKDSVDFGNVFRTSVQKRDINLSNNGRDVLNVSSLSLKNGKFSVADDLKSGFSVAAGQSKDITVQVPTDEKGAVSDTLTIAYADGTSNNIALKANVIGCPAAVATPESDVVDVPYGETAERTFSFKNNGDENLTVNVEDADWFTFKNVEADGEKTTVDYNYVSQVNGDETDYNWIDITGDYDEHMNAAYFVDQTDYKEVTLPFTFTFYGKKYQKMYIYDTGFVQFDEPEVDYHQFPEPPASLPTTETFYTNIICPFWGNHSMNTATEDGVYYKAYDDHAVVSYINYGNTMMYGMNFQLILNNDGTFKFQYKLDADGFMSQPFGLCGIMNSGGTRGVQPSSSNIESGNAVVFRPTMGYVLAQGETAEVPVEIAANKLAGTYENTLNVTTNDPAKESIQIPVTLNITGEALPVMPDSICMSQVVDENSYMAEVEFEIANSGKRAFTISNIAGEMIEMDDWGQSQAQIQVYTSSNSGGGDDPGPLSLTDDSNMAWTAWYPGYSSPITVGLEPVKFKFVYFQPYQTCEKTSSLTFTIDGIGDKVVPVNIHITDAPHMTFDREEIVIDNASDNLTKTETLNISNDGAYKLEYSLKLDPSGNDEVVEESYGGYDPMMAPSFWQRAAQVDKAQAESIMAAHSFAVDAKGMNSIRKAGKRVSDEQHFVYDVPQGVDYTNLLYYPVFNPVTSAVAVLMGTGSSELDQNFYAATRFIAPAEGFNLSKLYFVGTVGTLENVDIEANVVLGSKVNAKNCNIGHGKIHIDAEEEQYNSTGMPRILDFDKAVYINPNDTFYVVLKYPAGYKSSALMASKDGDTSTDRYMCYLKSLGGWVDLEALYDEAYSYGAFGYFMTCIEEQKGEPWIKLLNSETEGEIAVGESLPVNLAVNAKAAYYDKQNKATLVVKSNDPTQKTVNYHIWLNKNGAPEVTAPSGVTSAPQGSETTVALSVADADGDAFTINVNDNNGFASIGECTNANGTTDGITIDGNTVSVAANTVLNANVTLAPAYGSTVGAKTFYVVAEDANGNKKETGVNYYVEYTNRAPEFTGETEMTIYRGETTSVNYYANLFSDPDGDAMTYTVAVKDSRYADVFEATNGFVLCGKRNGKTKLTVTATDENGATKSQSIDLTVTSPSGIDGVSAGDSGIVADYSNGALNITLGEGAATASLRVYTTAGSLLAETVRHNVAAGETVALATGNIPTGVYQLAADIDGKTTTVKFVVK